MADSKIRNTRTRMDVDIRKEELLELGRKLFGQLTYDEISIAGIAEKAGISKGLLYHYFPTKREFYIETVRACASRMLELTESATDIAPWDRLHQGIEAYLKYAQENSSSYLYLLRSGIGVDPEVSRIVESVRDAILKRITEGLEISNPNPLQRAALRGWIGFAEAASADWLDKKGISTNELRKLLTRQLIFSLSASGAVPHMAQKILTRVKGMIEVPNRRNPLRKAAHPS